MCSVDGPQRTVVVDETSSRGYEMDVTQQTTTTSDHHWMYRAMKAALDGRPELDATARTLGARPGRDIVVEESGFVRPGPNGMSVTLDEPRRLPRHRRPRSLGGEGRDPLFRMCSKTLLPSSLVLRRDEDRPETLHGMLTPAEQCRFTEYQTALHSTRPHWEAC
ncbi:MAG: hypothetical protein ACI9OJ_002444 [Myxococcota bacterium]|jgi:hypothetical protein